MRAYLKTSRGPLTSQAGAQRRGMMHQPQILAVISRANYLRLSTRVLILLSILTSTASAGRMTFEYRYNQSNAADSDWIAAEGEIVDDSADDLEKSLQRLTGSLELRLHSHGGSLIGGIKLGELIRKRQLKTVVGRTVRHPDFDGVHTRADGVCVSACAIAFIGGVERSADEKSLGIHQFYEEASLKNPTERLFNALDMSNQQVVSALLIDYAFRMVDPRLIAARFYRPWLGRQLLRRTACII
jgi:hypothetical protein